MILIALGVIGGIGYAAMNIGAITGAVSGDYPQQPDQSPDQGQSSDTGLAADEVRWSEYKTLVGLQFPAQTASETVVFVSEGTTSANYDSAQVTSIGADGDEQDATELFSSNGVEEGTDYYAYNTFDSAIKSGLPPAATYKVAVIGSGVVNQYQDVEISETTRKFRVEQGAPIQPISSTDLLPYAADSNVSVGSTNMYDGSQGIAFDSNFTDDRADTDVDGSITGTESYNIAGDTAVQFGEISVSSVASQVNTVTVTVMADGNQVEQISDSDFTDTTGLDNSVEFGSVTAEDTVTVETYVEYDDSSLTTATALVTSTLDDIDSDSLTSDGSFGITKLSTTWTGY